MCVFCDISSGRIPAEVVLEEDGILAFLDIRPLFPGHCLLIPRSHFETLGDVPAELIGPLFEKVQLLSRAVPAALDARGSFVAINNKVSQSVPHLHVHVVPRNPKDGLKGFFWPRQGYDGEEHIRATAAAIREALVKEQRP